MIMVLMVAANGVACAVPAVKRHEYEINATDRQVTLFHGGRQLGRPEIASFGDTSVGAARTGYVTHEEEQFEMRGTSAPAEALLDWGDRLRRSGREKVDLNF
jgi:hypothetical protein